MTERTPQQKDQPQKIAVRVADQEPQQTVPKAAEQPQKSNADPTARARKLARFVHSADDIALLVREEIMKVPEAREILGLE